MYIYPHDLQAETDEIQQSINKLHLQIAAASRAAVAPLTYGALSQVRAGCQQSFVCVECQKVICILLHSIGCIFSHPTRLIYGTLTQVCVGCHKLVCFILHDIICVS